MSRRSILNFKVKICNLLAQYRWLFYSKIFSGHFTVVFILFLILRKQNKKLAEMTIKFKTSFHTGTNS